MTARLVTVAAAVAALGVLASAGAAAGTLPWSSPWGTFTDISTNTNYGPVTYDRRGRVNASGARVNITVTVVPSSCTPGSDVTLISGGLAARAETGAVLCSTVNNADGGYTTSGSVVGLVQLRLSPPGWNPRPVTLPAYFDVAGKARGQAEPTRVRVMEFGVRWTFGYHRSFLTNGKRMRAAWYRVVDKRLLTP